ncbi:MAG: SDR family NAD(P)-dependent oxidoreductase [Myxococcota bacterium]
MSERFADQVVWITGGGSGLGLAMAVEFARQGAHVAVSGRRVDRLEDAVSLISAEGRRGLVVPCDVTDEDQMAAAARRVYDAFGRVDVVVANAGFGVSGRVDALSIEDWRRQFDVNVIGLVATVKYALPLLRKSRGRLALIGSAAAFFGAPKAGAYNASKAAVRSIGETLYVELAGTGVTCTTIHPGFVESEIAQVDNQGRFHADRRDGRPQRLMWPADRAARVMLRAIYQRRREVTFTGHGWLIAFLGSHFPGLTHWLISLGTRKRNQRMKSE